MLLAEGFQFLLLKNHKVASKATHRKIILSCSKKVNRLCFSLDLPCCITWCNMHSMDTLFSCGCNTTHGLPPNMLVCLLCFAHAHSSFNVRAFSNTPVPFNYVELYIYNEHHIVEEDWSIMVWKSCVSTLYSGNTSKLLFFIFFQLLYAQKVIILKGSNLVDCILLWKYMDHKGPFGMGHFVKPGKLSAPLFLFLSLTHWGRDKMDAISQTTSSIAFSWMKMFEFRLKFQWSLFLRAQLTIFQHWFR